MTLVIAVANGAGSDSGTGIDRPRLTMSFVPLVRSGTIKSMMRLAVAAIGLGACSPANDLTCELLANPSNCFAQTTAAVAACMPMRATPATLSADKMTCTFADGVYVVLPIGQNETQGIRYEIHSADGSVCGRVAYASNVSDLIQVSRGAELAEWETPYDNFPYRLTCPSHTYTNANGGLAACYASMPQFIGTAVIGTGASVTVVSAATPSPLFTCQ